MERSIDRVVNLLDYTCYYYDYDDQNNNAASTQLLAARHHIRHLRMLMNLHTRTQWMRIEKRAINMSPQEHASWWKRISIKQPFRSRWPTKSKVEAAAAAIAFAYFSFNYY